MELGQRETRTEVVNTTVGELIEAITDIALKASKSEEEGYLLARATLEQILRRAHKHQTLNDLR